MRKRCIYYLLVSLTLAALLGINIVQTVPPKEHQLPAWPRPTAYNLARPQGPTYYDEQLACTFTQNVPSLSYTVTAVGQSGTDGYGPAYLVNGLGNTGYWYQVGLSYNWSLGSGFQLNYEVFNSSDRSVFPSDGGGGLATFSPVNQGDTVLLSLSFSSGNVIMQGTDQNTGAHTQETYSAAGATTFVGSPSAVANPAGFWTGLMTEWYHTAPYYGDEQSVTYNDNGAAITSAWMWMEELAVSQNGVTGKLFSASTPSPVTFTNPAQFQTLTSNGATESINATQFITGGGAGAATVALSFGYSIAGGAGTSSAPVLTYVTAGAHKTATLTQANQTFSIDSGTTWNITNPTSSSTSTERWQTSQPTTGTATSAQTIDLVFYHQYLVTFDFSVVGGGTSYSAPVVTCQQFGSQITPSMGAQVWTDPAQYTFDVSLTGSSSSERWTTSSAAGTVSAPGSLIAAYSHQYYVTTSLDPASGGSISVGGGWFDAGASFQPAASASPWWQFEGWNGSGQGSYSGASSSASVTVNAPLTETATFYPGLSITASGRGSISYSEGGTTGQVLTSKTIFAPLGTTIQLSAKPRLFIYAFTGWSGSSVSSQSNISIVLNAPLSVSANYSYNYVIIGIALAVLVAVIAGLILLVLVRRRSKRHMKAST